MSGEWVRVPGYTRYTGKPHEGVPCVPVPGTGPIMECYLQGNVFKAVRSDGEKPVTWIATKDDGWVMEPKKASEPDLQESEVKITPEMRSAGASLLGPWAEYERGVTSELDVAEAIFLAMVRASKTEKKQADQG